MAISRTTEPNIGLFAPILMHFSCWIQIWQWKFELRQILKKLENFWSVVCTRHTVHIDYSNVLRAGYNPIAQHLKNNHIFSKTNFFKNYWTNTRLVCTHSNAFFTLNPNMAMTIWISKFFEKKFRISTCRLHSTSTQRGLLIIPQNSVDDFKIAHKTC